MTKKEFNIEFAGKPLKAEFSDLAEQANGAVTVRYDDTLVLATAVMSKNAKEGRDFMPLTVDYEEKFYAAGEILGSRFVRREARPSEEAILVSRVIDRTIRPLFDQRIRNDIQIMAMVLSIDGENDPDIPAILAASLALAASDIPWNGPVVPIRIGYLPEEKRFVLNPTYEERGKSILDLVACSKTGKINMIEAGAKEIDEKIILQGLKEAEKELEKIEKFQKEIAAKIGKTKIKLDFPSPSEKTKSLFNRHIRPRLEDFVYIVEKPVRLNRIAELKEEWMESVGKNLPEEDLGLASGLYEEAIGEIFHKNILEKDKRPDGRALDEIRELFAGVDILPRVHGSGLFYRGETHVLSALTLGGPQDVLIIEGMEIRGQKHFMHHYNFPPFSTGETGRSGSPGRREIGHGALVEKALLPVVPKKEDFPYTVRIVSETLSSNGSTSMASTCASTLALMAAGVPIKNPVAGISMGLAMEKGNEKNFKILTDIQGPEDHHGDMDFKIARTKEGVTALQLDVKIEGITPEIIEKTFLQAKPTLEKILKLILEAIPSPRKELPKTAPRIIRHQINPEKIRDLIGPGGRVIQNIIAKTETEIDVEQSGVVYITGKNEESAQRALEIIKDLTREFKVGEVAEGVVSRIFEFGAMVEIAPGQEGLVHISEIAPQRINQVRDYLEVGDPATVKVIGIDDLGRINLSIKEVGTIQPKQKSSNKTYGSEQSRGEKRRERRQDF